MMKLAYGVVGATMAALLAAPAMAGNGAPNGPHYNLNIIGVEKGKTSSMTGSNRHTIFVALGRTGQATSRIYLAPAQIDDFRVCDGNAFDTATDCNGDTVAATGAVFELPCNRNLSDQTDTDGDGIPDTPVEIVACDGTAEDTSYEVWARALGKPNGSATITTCAFDPDVQDEICSSENVILVRDTGKSTFKNVTNELTSLVANIDDDAALERIALFSGGLEDWFWQFDNRGLRLAQLRFYILGL